MKIYHRFNQDNPNEVSFYKEGISIAIGEYDQEHFHLLEDGADEIKQFSNAMQAFSYLRTQHDTLFASPQTLELISKPARLVDNLSKFKYHKNLENIDKDTFLANDAYSRGEGRTASLVAGPVRTLD